jgi:hypothetical protein
MAAKIVPFPYVSAPVQPLAQFIRLGENGYQKLASLQAAGRLPAKRVVVDASKLVHQRELIEALRSEGAEIVLDTKLAELAAPARFEGYPKGAPWAILGDGKPLGPHLFAAAHPGDIFGQIASFAVEHRAHAVLAPGHYIADPLFSGWFDIDRASCEHLRRALDREGGSEIAIDYLLVLPATTISDDERRSTLVEGLTDLPFDNLWVRASGFGNDASVLGTKRFIMSLSALHNLGKPIVADYLGGMIGMATLAFGAVSGVAHGIGERERFEAGGWHKPAKKNEDGPMGRAKRITIAGLDKSLTLAELQVLASARGGKRLIACNDRRCCPAGVSDMISDPRRHAAFQGFNQFEELARVPDLQRENHFVNKYLGESQKIARQVRDLKPSPDDAAKYKVDVDALMKRLHIHANRQEKLYSSLEHLYEQRDQRPGRARPVKSRTAPLGGAKEQTK